ncbi:hypothetical protein MMC26_004458 [Xylographa opegraphella]|nr:hypothetical protein [Xylographa opegraphella]
MARRFKEEGSLNSLNHRPQINIFLRIVDRNIIGQRMVALNQTYLDDVFTGLQVVVPDGPEGSTICGRHVKRFVDMALCRQWLHACESNHASHCISGPRSEGLEEAVEYMNLIDVRRRRIVKAMPNSRYVALSYVWGPASLQKFQATNDKFSTFSGQIDGIRLPKRLPKTIEDAMHVVSQMKEHFLWVDSLCIIQDDLEARNHQISYMNVIYGNAVVTIVAACGSDSNAGLPGVGSTPRPSPLVKNVQGIQLMTVLPSAEECIMKSTWNKRGWTLQEKFFSQRFLIFTQHQVHFRCGTGSWREDMRGLQWHHEFANSEREADVYVSRSSSSPQRTKTPMEMPLGPYRSEDMLELHTGFTALVEDYTSRELTKSSDIIHAVVGVARAMLPAWGTFVCGLPLSAFPWVLLWRHQVPLVRRPLFFSSGSRKDYSYPSWSWAGWQGPIKYIHDRDILINSRSRVIWYEKNEIVGTRALRPKIDETRFYSKSFLSYENGNHVPNIVMDSTILSGHESTTLLFWASSAIFRLDGGLMSREPMRIVGTNVQLPTLAIYDRKGNWVGQAILDEGPFGQVGTNGCHNGTFHKLICLSQTSCDTFGFWVKFDHEYRTYSRKGERNDNAKGHKKYEDQVTEYDNWGWLNVLVVKPSSRVPPDNPPAFVRAGIGMIRMEAWKAADPYWRLINLQ